MNAGDRREGDRYPLQLSRRLLQAAAERNHDVRRIRRGETSDSPAFDLAYVRSGPRSDTPVVVVPGGPGLASVLPYGGLRRQAAADGLDLIMVEHRGVGLSRSDLNGVPLPESSMWVESAAADIAAVLDAEGAGQAYLAGSSYGTYLASTFAAKYPGRVAGLLLDSPLLSVGEIQAQRTAVRSLFWEAPTPAARMVRALVAEGEDQRVLLDVIRAAYELLGASHTEELLRRRLSGRLSPAWKLLVAYAARGANLADIPGYYEFSRAGTIGFRELDYAPALDGHPMDPALTYQLLAGKFPPFLGEPYDIPATLEQADWPLVLLAGSRDLRTPVSVADGVAERAPRSVVGTIENGHSALDTHMLAFEKTLKLLVAGRGRHLPKVITQLDALPRRGGGAQFAKLVKTILV